MSAMVGDAMVGKRRDTGRGLRSVRAAIDAMDASFDEQRSDEMFNRLMVRLQVEQQRRQRRAWLWRMLSVVAGVAVAGASALSLLH
jgi:hypothetical protein